MVGRYKWSPPKKTDDRAWKRIENGEWLWDRRRVRRHNRGWAEVFAIGRARRKGYRWHATGLGNTKDGPDIDMGG